VITAAGFDPVKAGGVSDAARIEVPDGDLHQNGGLGGRLLDTDRHAPPSQPPDNRDTGTPASLRPEPGLNARRDGASGRAAAGPRHRPVS
jgi:hypothetical protein